MEQLNKFSSQSHTKNTIHNQILHPVCTTSAYDYQLSSSTLVSNASNPLVSSSQNGHQQYPPRNSKTEQQSAPSSSLSSHHFRQENSFLPCGNTSNSLQPIKSKIQNLVEFTELTHFGDKSNAESFDNLIDTIQEYKIQSENAGGKQAAAYQSWKSGGLKSKNYFDKSAFNKINTENVIDILQDYNFSQLKFSRNYSSRKQFVACKLKLKDILLFKYQLSQIPKIQTSFLQTNKSHEKPKIKKQIRRKVGLRELLIRKLYKVIRKAYPNQVDKQKSVIKIISRIQQNNAIQSQGFRRNIFKELKKIRGITKQTMTQEEQQIDLNQLTQNTK